MELKALLFDFCGTITSNEPLHWQSIRAAFASVKDITNSELTDEELQSFVGLQYEDRFTHLLAARGIDDMNLVDTLVRQAKELYTSSSHTSLVPGVENFIRTAHSEGILLTVVSNAHTQSIKKTLEEYNLLPLFSSIVGNDSVQFPKPHPYPYEAACINLGVAPKECIAFEDSPIGLEAARLAGIQTIGITTTFSSHDLHHAVKTIRDFSQLDLQQVRHLLQ